MVLVYVKSGEWMSSSSEEWSFVVDKDRRGRMVTLDATTLLERLKIMVCEDYGVEPNSVNVELSYEMVNQRGNPPIIISNDRQVANFMGYAKKGLGPTLCVTFSSSGVNQKERVNIDLNKEPCDSSNIEDEEVPEINPADFVKASKEPCDTRNEQVAGDGCGDENGDSENKSFQILTEKDGKSLRPDFVKKDQIFRSKMVLKATMEIWAMKHHFDYTVNKSTRKWWYIRCKDRLCNWAVRAGCLDGSTYFMINKCEGRHTCAPSKRSKFGKTASARTIGSLIQHRFDDSNEGPKSNEILQFMRMEHSVEITYSHAWEAHEFAIAAVRGIPDESYAKIPKYLHMIKEANPGMHTHYETVDDGRFLYLFMSFGQSVRGFYNTMRRVIVVDGTFLKNKYKGVLLVATAVDGNYNLYPLAFGVVDSENDDSWGWFFRQLKEVVADSHDLAFVSDRNSSIAKAIATVYPRSAHGICIHHLLTNVVKHFKEKGLTALVEQASKAYRYTEFQERITEIFDMNPELGRYLREADVRKWARSVFPGSRYDIRTTNPAESINSLLKIPRKYPVIPLLDSIREFMTRWFYERRLLSSKHLDPLTVKAGKKIDRRIVKAKGFQVYKIDNFRSLVKGDKYDCHVDLRRRTCTCGKYDIGKMPCRHVIPAIYSRGREVHSFTDDVYTTATWRKAYEESINPIAVPESDWNVPAKVKSKKVLPPDSRKNAGRPVKRRYETVEDKIKASQGSSKNKKHKCSRCGNEGHKRGTCDLPI
ncbi:uncharacterized protein LOC130507068 [Raphanus sativus]|uniref:Uncharacterized protein LOC108808328 n=1 Tax=Raphanus sativus TaxID=3726 RepID=A0A9W3CHA7_RAPSA|nr:uncharacterized protein LOC108808328 [Raphanus sativus]XP_056850900.1 uncharacterized protein LOC130500170 [Raphanus sativus]XP_056857761.1 uncharacterized protein LOC130507068 [Raphanus sativus]